MLENSMDSFLNNQALATSIMDMGGKKYVPVYENKEKKETLKVKGYIKVCIQKGLDLFSLRCKHQMRAILEDVSI